jgi:hypothetical protein
VQQDYRWARAAFLVVNLGSTDVQIARVLLNRGGLLSEGRIRPRAKHKRDDTEEGDCQLISHQLGFRPLMLARYTTG